MSDSSLFWGRKPTFSLKREPTNSQKNLVNYAVDRDVNDELRKFRHVLKDKVKMYIHSQQVSLYFHKSFSQPPF